MKELMNIVIIPRDPKNFTCIGSQLEDVTREKIIERLRHNADIFAWTPQNSEGINPNVINHHLNIHPHMKPMKQKNRYFRPKKDKIIQVDVNKLLTASHIEEIQLFDWLSNVVLVPKPEAKWRMPFDFKDLNNACPKNFYPIPRIDQLVDFMSGCGILSMMDALQGTFWYVVIPFGLKNIGASYQRLVDNYADDMLVKNKKTQDHVADLEETFAVLRKHRLKLKPGKCTFGVNGGSFLRFVVT
ncbi:UNVERIFIED_CONTAM: Polyprotein P3 [Sesamum indicum]